MANIHKDSPKGDIIAALREQGFDAPDGDATQAELLELLSSVTGETYSSRTDGTKKAPAKRKAAAKKKHTIIIPSGETKASQGDVFVGYNGKGFQIKRDVEVEVPVGVVEVLRNAKQKMGRQLEDGSVEMYEVHTYPFSVVA